MGARSFSCSGEAGCKTICDNFAMCGRYKLSRRKQIVEERFEAVADDEVDWSPRYNIAPTQSVPVIRQNEKGARKISLLRWGLIPSWATDASIGNKTINARVETVATTPSFREPFQSRRCLIPADGFYEWKRLGKLKQPYCFDMEDASVFAFAGLWDRWIDPNGMAIESFTILTTTANDLLANLHHRMPVIVRADDYRTWLEHSPGGNDRLKLLQPYAGGMRSYPVSERLNLVQNDDEQCALPMDLQAPSQGNLFG